MNVATEALSALEGICTCVGSNAGLVILGGVGVLPGGVPLYSLYNYKEGLSTTVTLLAL